jgi:protein-tyrosine phosphatase
LAAFHPNSEGRRKHLVEFNWFLPNLAVGGRVPAEVMELLNCQYSIRRVIDLRSEECDDLELCGQCEIEHLYLPTPDMTAVSQEMPWQGVQWVQEGFALDHKVLIHCEYGIGRSVLLACCVLVSLGHTPSAALETAKRARRKASPSPEQLHALLQWSEDWHNQQSKPCPGCTWDDLARIAYRNG